MDNQEPTPWEDTNPPMVSARPPEPRLPSLVCPATRDDFRNELTACLALVVPVGMTEEGRREWLAVAWQTVGYLPADLLRLGCRKAREKADHPSKIVPIILAETSYSLERRREHVQENTPRLAGPKPQYCTPDQAKEILAEFGLASRFASNRDEGE